MELLYYQTCTLETFEYGVNYTRDDWQAAMQLHPGTNDREESFGKEKLVENSRQTFLSWKPCKQQHTVPKRTLPNWLYH
jgi:hypothetical protein